MLHDRHVGHPDALAKGSVRYPVVLAVLAHDIRRLGHEGTNPPRATCESRLSANDAWYRLRLVPAGDPLRPITKPVARRRDRVPPPTLKLYEEFHPHGSSAYRAVDSTVEVSAKRYRYTGKERDEETGLDHMGARYYAGWLGRWTSADPIGLGDGLNRYAYVPGQPGGYAGPERDAEHPFSPIQNSFSGRPNSLPRPPRHRPFRRGESPSRTGRGGSGHGRGEVGPWSAPVFRLKAQSSSTLARCVPVRQDDRARPLEKHRESYVYSTKREEPAA